MNKKICLFLLIIILIGVECLFAQDSQTKLTFGGGCILSSFNSEAADSLITTIGFDADFVRKNGFTIGLQAAIGGVDDLFFLLPGIGVGYTYSSRRWGSNWSAGAKLTGYALYVHAIFFGIDGNATYWFGNNIGVTGTLASYFSIKKGLINIGSENIEIIGLYPVKIGISMRF